MTSDKNEPPSSGWLDRISSLFESDPKDRQALINILRDAESRGLINADALGMLEGVLQVSEMHVRDVMVPRPKMVVVERDDPMDVILKTAVTSNHSRLPVLGENRDDIVGILLAKDLLQLYYNTRLESDSKPYNIRDFLRPAVIIPESKRLDVLLKEFRLKRNHMALVVDEYGIISGLVTIEDVLEQIVGEIEDETDVDDGEDNIYQQDSNIYNVKALTDIEDFNHYFGIRLEHPDIDTVGGLVMQAFGHLPARGESVSIDKFNFTILHADKRRVRQLRVEIKES